jgi:hypothetical protein
VTPPGQQADPSGRDQQHDGDPADENRFVPGSSSGTAVFFSGVGAASTATEPTAIGGEAAGRDIAAATAWPTPSAADADSTPASACVGFRGVPHDSHSEPPVVRMGRDGVGDTLPG